MPLSVDNAAIHDTQEAVDAFHATGAMVIFLSPYSPDFMPLEELFAQVKNWVRENDAAWQFCQGPELMVEEAFLHVTDKEVKNYRWFSRYVIAAMLVDENKRFLISSFCSSTSNCTLQHCYLCPKRLVANHLYSSRRIFLISQKSIFYFNVGIITNLKSTEFSEKFLLLTNKLVI